MLCDKILFENDDCIISGGDGKYDVSYLNPARKKQADGAFSCEIGAVFDNSSLTAVHISLKQTRDGVLRVYSETKKLKEKMNLASIKKICLQK